MLRRQAAARTSAQPQTERGGWRFGGWQLQRRSRRLTGPDGAPVALTRSEYVLLAAFLNAPQQALSREHLLSTTRVREDIFDRSIDVQVLRLRRKLEGHPHVARRRLPVRPAGRADLIAMVRGGVRHRTGAL